jgi:hypothetical protein
MLPVLQTPLAVFGYRVLRVHAVLGYALSFIGLVWLSLSYARWRQNAEDAAEPISPWVRWRDGIVLAALFLPVAATRHLFGGTRALLFVAVASMLLIIAMVLRSGAVKRRKNGGPGA